VFYRESVFFYFLLWESLLKRNARGKKESRAFRLRSDNQKKREIKLKTGIEKTSKPWYFTHFNLSEEI